MREEWTGNLVGRMHNAEVTRDDLAKEVGWTKSYVSMVLTGKRRPDGAEQKLNDAFQTVLNRKQ